jgi:hypothetical protein
MSTKRLWIALLTIPVCLISVLVIGAQRSQPVNAGGVIDPTCVSSLPCIEYDNNGTGPGIRGVSLTGNGSNGITRVNSTSTATGREGVFGNDMSTSGSFNSGVRGLSVRGTGVLGNSTSGAGVLGQTSNGAGVSGISSSGSGVSGTSLGGKGAGVFGSGVILGVLGSSSSSSGIGVAGSSTSGKGISGQSSTGPGVSGTSSSGDGVDGSGNTGVLGSGTNIGVLGHSTSGEGVLGTSSSGVAVSGTSTSSSGVLGSTGSSSSAIAGVQGNNTSTSIAVRANGIGGPLFVGNGSSAADVFTVDDTGNVHAHSFTANLAAATGQKVVTYAPQASEPTIEDFGEAQLTNGSAYVQFDSRFAGTMARGLSYLVFITPEGMTHGTLCVTQRTASGFTVQENQGGRSSVAFAYRIVAKPFGNQAPRFPLFVEHRVPKVVPRLHN